MAKESRLVVTFSMPPRLLGQLDVLARRFDIPRSQVVRHLLMAGIASDRQVQDALAEEPTTVVDTRKRFSSRMR